MKTNAIIKCGRVMLTVSDTGLGRMREYIILINKTINSHRRLERRVAELEKIVETLTNNLRSVITTTPRKETLE